MKSACRFVCESRGIFPLDARASRYAFSVTVAHVMCGVLARVTRCCLPLPLSSQQPGVRPAVAAEVEGCLVGSLGLMQ